MIKNLIERLTQIIESDFARTTYTQAIAKLEEVKDRFEYPVAWGLDLQTEHERYLTEEVFGKPVFVTDYPKEIKAFYMRLNDDKKTVAAMDLLVPGVGEIIGGIPKGGTLRLVAKTNGRTRTQPCGLPMVSGFKKNMAALNTLALVLGFERLIMYLTGIANIRDVIPFPRTTGQAEF